ncbi:unnamed protein product [Lactuca saligna]|uniref:Exostosin GT47 domain-containing protein n=1 Tax=Lactuca saligna TaxID=75948 RepID=A0AA36EB52_LACSI|nr:unnamed protein product [Lactuca saligna]
MGQKLHSLMETKRLVYLVAVVFAVFMMFQYLEFPYGDVISSLFSANSAQKLKNGSFPTKDSSQIPQIVKNITHFHGSSYTKPVSIPSILLPPSISPSPPITLNTTTQSDPKKDIDASKSFHDFDKSSSANEVAQVKGSNDHGTMGEVVTISEMREMLGHNRASFRSMKPRWSSAVDQVLLDAKFQIENAPVIENDLTLDPSLYVNVSRFKRSYELMEKTLKVYIYKEGEKPIFHQPQAVLKGIYASEGWFMKHMKASKHFVTKNPKEAHLFYLPFSSRMLEEKLYVVDSHTHKNLIQYLKKYLDLISGRYNFWNRTSGSDHFLVACHDWAPSETKKYMNNCIRAMCNSDVKNEGFELGKDVALPETTIQSAKNPLKQFGGQPPSKRSTLAFFAGRMHGDLRPILLRYWENKDPEIKIFKKLPKSKNNKNYIEYMKSSKFCICAKGYEVNSPRVVEAIFYGCVPVIISDNFAPPFFEVLNWESFAVFLKEKDVPNLKSILVSISDSSHSNNRSLCTYTHELCN